MSGILFPDLAAAFGAAEATSASKAQRDYIKEDRETGKYFGAALKGDPDAQARVMTNPRYASALSSQLERIEVGKRAKVKEDADYITTSGMAILNAPPEQQPGLYARVRQEAAAAGRNVSTWPTQYDPSWVKFNVDKAMPFAEHFKRSGEGVSFAAPAGVPAAPGGGGRAGDAIAGIESGGRYDAVGPAANEKGNRAYGKYQIMDFNVGPWTQEVLGRQMTPQEFAANPQAQDAVFQAKFGQYVQKFGTPEAASRAWFAGEGGMNNPGAKDVLGTSVQGYGQRFAQAYGPGATGAPPGMAQGSDMPAADGSGTPLQPAQQALAPLRGLQIPPGARVALKGGLPVIQDGNVLYLDANGGWGAAPLPPRAAPKEQSAGPFAGNSVEAQALNMLIGNGTLTQPQAAELAAGKTITNPADGSVMFMTPSGLFGQKPGQQPQPVGGNAPGGQPPAGAPASAALPPGMIPVTPPKPVQMTEGQSNAALYADRMREAEAVISANEKAGMSVGGKALEMLPGGAGNFLQSDNYQLFEQARRNFINAVLRRESGAVIADTEFANAEKQYFPRPGDSEAVLKQKAANRRSALDGVSRAAGPSYKPTAEPGATQPPAQGAPKPPADNAERGRLIFDAQKAIKEGRDPVAVRARLKQLGVDPVELDAK